MVQLFCNSEGWNLFRQRRSKSSELKGLHLFSWRPCHSRKYDEWSSIQNNFGDVQKSGLVAFGIVNASGDNVGAIVRTWNIL